VTTTMMGKATWQIVKVAVTETAAAAVMTRGAP
jgi:hypothetical protein